MIIILRNYNRFLVDKEIKDPTKRKLVLSPCTPRWEDFYIHRFIGDYKKLKKFDSVSEAKQFLEENPHLEDEFDAWIEETQPELWD